GRDGGVDLAAPRERRAQGCDRRPRPGRRRSLDDRFRGREGRGASRREDFEAGPDHLGLLGQELARDGEHHQGAPHHHRRPRPEPPRSEGRLRRGRVRRGHRPHPVGDRRAAPVTSTPRRNCFRHWKRTRSKGGRRQGRTGEYNGDMVIAAFGASPDPASRMRGFPNRVQRRADLRAALRAPRDWSSACACFPPHRPRQRKIAGSNQVLRDEGHEGGRDRMPYRDPEKRREYDRRYREATRAKQSEYQRRYRETHIEAIRKKKREYQRRWVKDHPDYFHRRYEEKKKTRNG